MATPAAVTARAGTVRDDSYVVTWTGLANGENGAAVEMTGWADRSVQFTGTFSVNGTIQIEGSNDGTNYVVLTDPQGNNISKTAAALEMVTEITRYVRPRVTNGDGSTVLNCYLFGRRAS